MRKEIFLFLLMLNVIVANASQYYVFRKIGDVRVVCNGATVTVKERMELSDNDILYIGEKSSLTLTNSNKKTVTVIKKACQGKVKHIIKGRDTYVEIIKPLKSFFGYIRGLCSSDFVNEQNEVLRGITERGDSDKEEQERDLLNQVLDIIKKSEL